MNKKGMELPMNVIIIAAIALVVLVVILYIFQGRTSMFTKSLESCEAKQGTCKPTSGVGSCEGPTISGTNCEEKEKICCLMAT